MSSVINTIVTTIQDNIFFTCIVLAFILMALISSLAVIFHKIGLQFWKALIPLYNITTLLSALDIPIWMMLLMIIPFVNFIGLPFMVMLIGLKLGNLCHKNIVMKIGLMIFPILFLPLLAATKIDINKPYGANKIVVVPLPKKEFTLEPVAITNAVDVPAVLNLSNAEALDKITIKVTKEKPKIEKKEEYTKESVAEHLAKANKERPTAQDLTFDYNMIYAAKKEEEVLKAQAMENNPTFQLLTQAGMEVSEVKETPTDSSTLDYNNLYNDGIEKNTEPEIQFPKIHEVVLEEASPIDETSMGPIPINQRYDKQRKVIDSVNIPTTPDTIKNEEFLIQPVELVPIEIPQITSIQPELTNLNIAAAPIADNSISSIMASPPDIRMQTSDNTPLHIPEPAVINVPSVQIDQIVSMKIEEPDSLPVGILVKMDKGKNEEISVILPEELPTPTPQFVQQETTTSQQIENPQLLANPTMIFQSSIDTEPILRQSVQPMNNDAQLDKICPRCSVKLKRDCPVCIMCGYKF